MMEEIITLIINEAISRIPKPLPYALQKISKEITVIIDSISRQLLAVEDLRTSEDTKQAMRDSILTSHKT
ncbi:hypothetical protein ES703_65488 [subsurface metagenome]